MEPEIDEAKGEIDLTKYLEPLMTEGERGKSFKYSVDLDEFTNSNS